MRRSLPALLVVAISGLAPMQVLAVVHADQNPHPCFGVVSRSEFKRWDLDGDRLPDRLAIVPARANESSAVFVNDDPGQPITGNPQGRYYVRLWRVVDLDNDGDLDIVVAGEHLDQQEVRLVSYLVNDGKGRFSPMGEVSFKGLLQGLMVGDLDGDGLGDAVVDLSGDPKFVVWNNGGRSPGPVQPLMEGFPFYGLELADLDGDADLDVLTIAHGAGETDLGVVYNEGSRQFATLKRTSLAGAYATDVTSGDIDGDGDIDVATVGSVDVTLLINTGSGLAAPQSYASGALEGSEVLIGDIDGDGKSDLAIRHSGIHEDGYEDNPGVRVLYNQGAGKFSKPVRVLAGINGGVTEDSDGDGRLDMFFKGDIYLSGSDGRGVRCL